MTFFNSRKLTSFENVFIKLKLPLFVYNQPYSSFFLHPQILSKTKHIPKNICMNFASFCNAV